MVMLTRRLLFPTLATCLVACATPAKPNLASASEVRTAVPAVTRASLPVLSMTQHYGYVINAPLESPVVFALFDDGTFVWSVGDVRNGRYFRTTVAPADVAQLVTTLEPSWAALTPQQRYSWGPDSGYRSFALRTSGGTFTLGSWHSDDPNSANVADQRGMFPRSGRSDAELELKWSDDYRALRTAWRAALTAVEPFKQAPAEPLDRYPPELKWVENSAR
ncbi:MAG: hypothetical protein EPO68_09685 [Planctomycetota bacterium]|nr:MAG: hypothetical protein EPO68_09685 [Planctomycetota bacterium]